MLYKESAIAVMIATMLGAASLLGGLSFVPALAIHDPDATTIADKQISQADTESMIVDAIELTAVKSTARAIGTVTVNIIQDDKVLRTASLETSELKTSFSTVTVDVNDKNVTGTFEILVEYRGSASITVSEIDVIEGTQTSGIPDDSKETPNNPPSEPHEEELDNVVASKTVTPDGDNEITVDTVKFVARKSTQRAIGTLTVSIVQDGQILGEDTFSTSELKTSYQTFEASFDDLKLTGEFEVAFMYEGRALVFVDSVMVEGVTETSEDPTNGEEPSTPVDGTISLTVNSVNQNNEPITGLWFTVTNGMTTQGDWTEKTLELEAGQYTVTMDDFYDDQTDTMYTFVEWTDSTQGKSRTATLNTDETFTAKYNVVSNAPPPADNPPSDPSDSPPTGSAPGTITAYAYRIPSSFWGPTFVNANAQMYYVLYNSTGYMIYGGFYDENGDTISDLSEGETYWIMPTDCHHCHGGTHDVAFNHWEDGSTERARAVTTGTSVGAYYEYVPDTP